MNSYKRNFYAYFSFYEIHKKADEFPFSGKTFFYRYRILFIFVFLYIYIIPRFLTLWITDNNRGDPFKNIVIQLGITI